MKLCKDCKNLSGIHCMAGAPPMVTDYVNGGMRHHPALGMAQSRLAQDERATGKCGNNAQFFEAKQ